ncbi:MAG: hypothetical protein IKP40_14665 [Clostridia bacterium]|nr:hypothetical protein [Clostridia bacterium]
MALFRKRQDGAGAQAGPVQQPTGYAALSQQAGQQSHYDPAYYPPNPPPGQYGYQPQPGNGQPAQAYPPQQGYAGQLMGYAGQPQQGYAGQPMGYAAQPQPGPAGQQPYGPGNNAQGGAPAQGGQPVSGGTASGYAAMNQPPRQEEPVDEAAQEEVHFGQNQQLPPPPPKTKGLGILQKLLIGAALALAVWYGFNTLIPEKPMYATVQTGTLGAHYEGDALIVRKEIPWTADGVTTIKYEAHEGQTVMRNQPICRVYSSGYSTREMATMQEFRDQIRDYQKSLLESETTTDSRMDRVSGDVLARSKEVRDIIGGARSNLSNQETLLEAAITARQNYIRQKYASDQRLSRLYDEELNQQQRIDSWTKSYAASEDTIVSVYSDGYEFGLTFDNAESFKPDAVRRMINGSLPEGAEISKSRTTIYRTVTDGEWLVLMLVDEKNWNPIVGETYELQLERFESLHVNAKVLSSERSGNELLLRLHVTGSVNDVLYMRTCRATIGDYVSTFTVPSAAIYRQDEMDGVVLVDGQTKSFIPVTVVYRDGANVYVSPINAGLLYEGLTVMLFY